METTRAEAKIMNSPFKAYRTKNYDYFKLLDHNREVQKVEDLKESIIRNGGIFLPILVSPEGYIFDGQHRFQALKELGKPIDYVVNSALAPQQIIELNTTQNRWRYYDYIDVAAKLGDANCIKLREVIDNYPHYKESLLAEMYSEDGRRATQDFIQGTYYFDQVKGDEMLESFEVIINEAPQKDIRKLLNVTAGRALIIVMTRNQGRFDAERFAHALTKNKMTFYSSQTDCADEIVRIYNHGLSPANRIA